MKARKYNVIGVMSGTSCDGLDIALCSFWYSNKKWNYKLIDSKGINYGIDLKRKLEGCSNLSGYELKVLDLEFGDFIAKEIKKFIGKNKMSIDLISSHGHTVFHDAKNKIHHQIGNPFLIYKTLNFPVIFNFRELDVILGGEGAPLVTFGERELFSKYDYCVNIGGILNISLLKTQNIIGYDVCPANIILNRFSKKLGHGFDEDGKISKKGINNPEVFEKLNQLSYNKIKNPKSLDLIYIKKNYYPLFDNLGAADVLHTFIDHIAYQVNENIKNKKAKVLVTGGGAFNKHLIEKINFFNKLDTKYTVPNKKLVIFKEAIVFGFLGLLRFLDKKNIENSVTGSTNSSSSGLILDNKII